MKSIRKKRPKSLIYLCVAHFVLCSLVTILVLALVGWLVNLRIVTNLPIMSDVLQYEDALRQDDFSQLSAKRFKNCTLLVLNEDFEPMHCTDSSFVSALNKEDIPFINSYFSNDGYTQYRYQAEDGQSYTLVVQFEYQPDDELPALEHYCIVNEERTVIEGNLFAGQKQLTETQYLLLSGRYQGRRIEKYSYTTESGLERTLIFLEKAHAQDHYEKKLRSAQCLWLLVLPLFALLILIQSLLLIRNIRAAVEPLNQTIVAYSNGKRVNPAENGMPTEFRGIVENFDQMLNRLEASQQEVSQTHEEKQRILTNLSHDLKTPISVIQGYAQALRDGVVPDAKRDQYLRVICDRADAMSELVSALLKYTRMEHANYVLSTTRTDFCEFSRQYLSAKYQEIELAGFQLELEIPETPIYLLIDHALLRRALDNLVGNSLKYNPPGTTLTFRLTARSNNAELIFADNGTGIPREILYTAFDPLVSGDQARTSGTGSGIGLSIVRAVAELHGGSVHLVLPPENGYSTEFCMKLPLSSKQ